MLLYIEICRDLLYLVFSILNGVLSKKYLCNTLRILAIS